MMYQASEKQVKLLVKLNKELKMNTSKKTFQSFTSQQASDRIQELILMKKLGLDPTAINWKADAAKAIREHQKNAGQVMSGETYRARTH